MRHTSSSYQFYNAFCVTVSAQTATKGNSNTATYVLLGLTCLAIGLLIAFGVVMLIRYRHKR